MIRGKVLVNINFNFLTQYSIQTLSKIIVAVLFFTNSIFACTICSLDVPTITVNTKITALQNKTHFEVEWGFDETFVSQLVVYDENDNGIYEEEEIAKIQSALEDYIIKYNYLSKLTYTKKHFTPTSIKINTNFVKTQIDGMTMSYLFHFDSNIILKDNHILKIRFVDENTNFNFILEDTELQAYSNDFTQETIHNETQIVFKNDLTSHNKKSFITLDEKEVDDSNTLKDQFALKLTEYKNKIKDMLKDIKENHSVGSYFWLLFFSLVYGILHAIGPGHGKTLVASYFLSHNRSIIKALNISFLIGITHTFSAFLLTVFIYVSLGLVFNSFITNLEYVATKISAIVIILIALYLIYKKLKLNQKIKSKNSIKHNPKINTCACCACDTKSEDLGVIIAAGIVPCPGTVTIFIFTFGLGIYYIGFLSAIFMSIGMSLIIFTTAYLSINIRKKGSKNNTLVKVFEYGSLLFILILGLILLFV
jgi:nickel/cobalt exporter